MPGSLWSPEMWDKAGVVGFVVVVAIFHVVAYMRGWFVPGRYHGEIVAAQESRIEQANARSAADAETIRVQAQTIAEKNAMDMATQHILQSIRDLASGKPG